MPWTRTRSDQIMRSRYIYLLIYQFNFYRSMYAKSYSLFGQVSYNILWDLAIIPRKHHTGSLAERWLPPCCLHAPASCRAASCRVTDFFKMFCRPKPLVSVLMCLNFSLNDFDLHSFFINTRPPYAH